MTIAKPNLFSMTGASTLIDGARALFASKPVEVQRTAAPKPTPTQTAIDQNRYARLLEKELDRQHLTDVEREDTEMLARVRSALYAD